MLDAIVDLRTPRILLLVRNAFGGAYASFNNYPTGADYVFALPSTRVAVMGPAGREFVYKKELQALRAERKQRVAELAAKLRESGSTPEAAAAEATREADAWFAGKDAELVARYEKALMNPKEGLSLGSISQIVMPSELRKLMGTTIDFCLRHYEPSPLTGVQREFH